MYFRSAIVSSLLVALVSSLILAFPIKTNAVILGFDDGGCISSLNSLNNAYQNLTGSPFLSSAIAPIVDVDLPTIVYQVEAGTNTAVSALFVLIAQLEGDLALYRQMTSNSADAADDNAVRQLTQQIWQKYGEALAKYEAFRSVIIGFTSFKNQCRDNLPFGAQEHMLSVINYWNPNLNGLYNLLMSIYPQLPNFLYFGIFDYPLPGITTTIDQFVREGKPILRYTNIIIVSVIAGIVGIALISIVVAGYLYVTAGGDSQKVTTAKSLIGAALLGIVLALGAFLILNTLGTQFASTLQEPVIPPP